MDITFAIPANDANHVYYQNDAVAGQVSRTHVAATTASDDSLLARAGQ
jgi:hypothetical protein